MEFDITLHVKVVKLTELDANDRALCEAAIESTSGSYAPYSHFHVGAAIRLDDSTVVCGNNQENVAYPSGTCAERTACFYAHASHPHNSFEAIAIAARDAGGNLTAQPTPPCGACRQALLEYEMLAGHDVKVMLVGAGSVYIIPSVHSLLPLAFTEF